MERPKWNLTGDVTAVIFVCALTEYNQVLREDVKQNRLKESLNLFDIACNRRYPDKPIILFLNKNDLFMEKIKEVDLKCCFPTYKVRALVPPTRGRGPQHPMHQLSPPQATCTIVQRWLCGVGWGLFQRTCPPIVLRWLWVFAGGREGGVLPTPLLCACLQRVLSSRALPWPGWLRLPKRARVHQIQIRQRAQGQVQKNLHL